MLGLGQELRAGQIWVYVYCFVKNDQLCTLHRGLFDTVMVTLCKVGSPLLPTQLELSTINFDWSETVEGTGWVVPILYTINVVSKFFFHYHTTCEGHNHIKNITSHSALL